MMGVSDRLIILIDRRSLFAFLMMATGDLFDLEAIN